MINKTKIKAEIVADSINQQGDRITSLLITFPRIILSEINTHRMLSKNTSSSRAIPFKKMVEAIQENPFIPIAWQKEHKGMQGTEYLNAFDSECAKEDWLTAMEYAVEVASNSNMIGVTKQLCNRLLEPFMWTTMLITGNKEGWDNFFELRCPSYFGKWKSWKETCTATGTIFEAPLLERLQNNKGQAEIHIMDLAEKIYDAMNESIPLNLNPGEWHTPFKDKIVNLKEGLTYEEIVKISTAMAARTSYTVVGDEKEIDYQRMVELHDRLIAQNPPHSSPMEHCARAMNNAEHRNHHKGDLADDNGMGWCRNFKGFIQYRHIVESNN